MCAQSPSPNALAATATNKSYRAGFGWNPNYLGTRPISWVDPSSGAADPTYTATSDTDIYGIGFGTAAHQFGPPTPDAGKGSLYELDVPVPLCHTPEDATPLTLELLNIPHHAFADPAQVCHLSLRSVTAIPRLSHTYPTPVSCLFHFGADWPSHRHPLKRLHL